MSSTIRKVFLDVHMGLSHDGLAYLARKRDVDVSKLSPGDQVLFLNRAGDKLKTITGFGRVISYMKMEKGRRIDLEALRHLPVNFGGTVFEYNKALERTLIEKLAKTRSRRQDQYVGPIEAARLLKKIKGDTVQGTTR